MIQLFFFCFLGTIVDISVCIDLSHSIGEWLIINFLRSLQNDKIYEEVKCFEWYRLTKNGAQMYQFFLNYVQQPQVIYVADVWELNMETCVFVSLL